MHEKLKEQRNPRNIDLKHDDFFDKLTWVTMRARESWAGSEGESRLKDLGFGKLKMKKKKKKLGF